MQVNWPHHFKVQYNAGALECWEVGLSLLGGVLDTQLPTILICEMAPGLVRELIALLDWTAPPKTSPDHSYSIGVFLNKVANNTSPVELIQLDSAEITKWSFAPQSDWTVMNDTDHFVQFYETDGFLLNSLSGFIGTGINAGHSVVVIATPEHREGLDELLLTSGFDLADVKASGRYLSLDAAETLSKFMVEGSPDPVAFHQLMGSIIGRVTDGRTSVRAFGEMVALLWAEGNHAGAIRLEELWNDLQKAHTFSLFCAYPMHGLGGEQFIESHNGLCTAHSRVIPAESYAALVSNEERLLAVAQLQQRAASLEAEVKERKLAEERLRRALAGEQMARAEAETANRMKDEFLATVSHELRTPLNAIIGWSHLLRSGSLDQATAARAMDTIDRNAKAQAQLIEDILDVSRMITGKVRLNKEPVDIAAVINASIDSVQLAIESKDIHLEVTLNPSARHTLGDSSRLQQVVWNLLSNAIKFTPSGGRIEVKLLRAGRNVKIQVIDSGQGIRADFLPFIFERFRQADGTTTRQHGGLGLGLAIVRHLVELHGGTIKAESPGEGMGSTFTVKLPQAPSPHRQRDSEITKRADQSDRHFSALPALDDVRVLLVDDDPDTLQILSMMLTVSKA
ncbi:MAG TPA: ATP-binding protein, partial [Pyrinomonadaceae bacterium]|nr:ATP-binding protein [Pyrinomonadaceae bacterium]